MSDDPTGFSSTVTEMAHELRTPLTSIMGFAELLLEDESITIEQRDYLKTISDEARRMSGMLNYYLSMLAVEENVVSEVGRPEQSGSD